MLKYLQYVSDLHLEFRKPNKRLPVIQPVVPGHSYLALCGDIGYPHMQNYVSFLKSHSGLYEHIFVIAGNHEYYSTKRYQRTMTENEQKLKEVCYTFPNVTYLQKDAKVIGNTVFLGCTLWAAFTEEQDWLAAESINDYQHIYVDVPPDEPAVPRKYVHHGKRFLQPSDIRGLHTEHVEWLKEKLEYYTALGLTIVVLTHHAPSTKLLSYTDDLSIFYASNLEYLMEKYKIKAWLSGHTHDVIMSTVADTVVASNCLGYASKENPLFNPQTNIEFI